MRQMWVIELFGTLALHRDGGPVPSAARQKRPLGMLAILALAGKQGLSRHRIEAYLWTESSAERAGHALNQTVYAIRQALGSDVFLSTRQDLRLNPDAVRVDVWEFDTAIAAGDWAAATRTYKGTLLDGYHFGESHELESWIDTERARLLQQYQAAIETLADGSAESGSLSQGVMWRRRLATANPLSAGVAKKLMIALAATGDRAGAVAHARVYQSFVRHELEIEPDSEVEDLASTLSRSPLGDAIAMTPAPSALGAASPDRAPPSTPAPPGGDARALGPPGPHPAARTAPEVSRPRSETSGRRRLTALAIAVSLVAIAWSNWYWRADTGGSTAASDEAIPSLAVLPFESLGNTDDAYFADGMTEELGSRLGTLSGVRLIGRQSAKRYARSNMTSTQIGKELGVAYLLTGSVRWDGSRAHTDLVNVSTSLIRARDGVQLWAESYQDHATGVFEIQGKIAERVARALDVRLAAAQRDRLLSPPTGNVAAYDFYLQGKALEAGARSPTEYLRAAYRYQEAIALDSSYALAYAALAHAQLYVYWYHGDPSPRRLALAKAAIDRALALDPQLAAGYTALAEYYYRGQLDYAQAMQAIAIARRAAPNDPDVLVIAAMIQRRQNRWAEATIDLNRAVALDPRNTSVLETLCETQTLTRDYDSAERTCGQLRALEPEKFVWYFFVSRIALLRSGDVQGALKVIGQAERQLGAEQFGQALVSNRSIWPEVTDPKYARYIHAVGEPAEMAERSNYFTSRLLLAEYQQDAGTIAQSADSVIVYARRALRGNFFDAQLHAELSLAYAAKGDRARTLEEGRESVHVMPFEKDALGWSENQKLVAAADVLVGADDEALAALGELLRVPSELSPSWLRVDPWFESLRQDPRFEQMASRH